MPKTSEPLPPVVCAFCESQDVNQETRECRACGTVMPMNLQGWAWTRANVVTEHWPNRDRVAAIIREYVGAPEDNYSRIP